VTATPRNATEELLVAIWAEALGGEAVGIHDNFFDLGGHSLLVPGVVSRLRSHGHDVGIGAIFECPTVAALAERIAGPADSGPPRLRSAVPIRTGSVTPPMFCVHSSTGGITEFAELAGHLGDGQQFIGLQSRGLTDDDAPLETIAEMAAAYAAEVLAIQPDGPHLIAAWSTGGYIAVEMGRLLRNQGHQVAGVYLIGPPQNALQAPADQPFDAAARALLTALDETIAADGQVPLPPEFEEQLINMWRLDENGLAAVQAGDKKQLKAGRVMATNYWAGVHHRGLLERSLPPYDGRVVMFLPKDDPGEIKRRTRKQWLPALVGTPETVKVPGDHRNVIHGRAAAAVGRWLKEEIARWRR
jgi:thioesterase domain-containing protein